MTLKQLEGKIARVERSSNVWSDRIEELNRELERAYKAHYDITDKLLKLEDDLWVAKNSQKTTPKHQKESE